MHGVRIETTAYRRHGNEPQIRIARNGPEQVCVAPRYCLDTMDAKQVLCVLTGHSGAFKVLRDARGRRSCALSPAIHEATAHALDQSLSLPMCERACACMRVRSVCQASARAPDWMRVLGALDDRSAFVHVQPAHHRADVVRWQRLRDCTGRQHVVGTVRGNRVRSHAARCASCTLSGCMLRAVCIVRWASRWTASRSAPFPLRPIPTRPIPA